VEKPVPAEEKKWSTTEEWEKMTPKERLARPLERVQLSWTPVKGQPPVVISRIYRGHPRKSTYSASIIDCSSNDLASMPARWNSRNN
jgi:hypothetical protein